MQKPTQHCKTITLPKKKEGEREDFSLCSFILSPNLVIILIIIALGSLSLKLLIYLSFIRVFSGILFLVLSFETNYSIL